MRIAASLALCVLVASAPAAPATGAGRGALQGLPARLSDAEFWRLSTELSEPGGYFRSENLVSNEHTFQYVIPSLGRVVAPGGVYLGVAPDQNFTYILATRPRMAFILDIRRGNLLQHLLYKALIELSADRAEFLSRLLSKPRPDGLTAASSVTDLFGAYARVATSEELYRATLRAVEAHLVKKRGFPLSTTDLDQIETIFFAFFWEGPSLRYSTAPMGIGARATLSFPTYEELMVQTDWDGTPRGYLAAEEAYRTLRTFQERNLLVPVVGNFAGAKALRQIGRYVRERGAVVSAFYVSNVEQYLYQDGLFAPWAENIATLPIDRQSTFIRSVSIRFGYDGTMLGPDGRASALQPIGGFLDDFRAGRLRSYYDLNQRSR
jgi:hypothetical protein